MCVRGRGAISQMIGHGADLDLHFHRDVTRDRCCQFLDLAPCCLGAIANRGFGMATPAREHRRLWHHVNDLERRAQHRCQPTGGCRSLTGCGREIHCGNDGPGAR